MENLSQILQITYNILADMPGKQGHVSDIAIEAIRINHNMGMDADTFTTNYHQRLLLM